MDEIFGSFIKGLGEASPFVVIVIVFLYFLRADRATKKEQNTISALQAETQNAMVTAQSDMTHAINDLRLLVSQNYTTFSATIAESQKVIDNNTSATLERSKAALEQARSTDRLSESFTVAMSNLSTSFVQALSTTSRDTTEAITKQISGLQGNMTGRFDNLDLDMARSHRAEDEAREVAAGQNQAFNHISEALNKNHGDLIRRMDDMPTILTRELKPVIDQWSTANERLGKIGDATLEAVEQLAKAEHELIKAIDRILPPPREVAIAVPVEALPINDRPAQPVEVVQ